VKQQRHLALAAVAMALLGTSATASGAVRPYDFNGDGRQDLAAGIPEWSDSGVDRAGAVIVQRAGRHGLTTSAQLLTRSTPGIPGDPHAVSGFGSDLASGDFNGDGFADLAIVRDFLPSSALTVVYGSAHGLDPSTAAALDDGESKARPPIAAADVDGDGFADLATAREGRDVSDQPIPSVNVFHGAAQGLDAARRTTLALNPILLRFADVNRDGHPDLVYTGVRNEIGVCPGAADGPHACTGIPTPANVNDVAVGDVTGDGKLEVVAGTAEYGVSGALHVYRWSRGSLRYAFRLDQATRGVPGNKQSGDEFGFAVAVGRIGRDRKADIVVGAPGEDSFGRVTIVRGAKNGVARHGNTSFEQDSPGVPGKNRQGDIFGASLALLDHNGDGRLDLDVGAPFESQSSGRVTVLYGARDGLTTKGGRDFGLESIGFSPVRGYEFGRILGR
jgi:hypothetical protein